MVPENIQTPTTEGSAWKFRGVGGSSVPCKNGKSREVGGSYVKFPLWWGSGYFLELIHIRLKLSNFHHINDQSPSFFCGRFRNQ